MPLTTNPLPGLAIAIAVSCARHNLATASRFIPRTNVNPSRPRLASFIASARRDEPERLCPADEPRQRPGSNFTDAVSSD